MFLGRENETKQIREELESPGKSVILLYGRRRVGKTALLHEVLKSLKDVTIIYHEFHRITLQQNIGEFSSSIGRAFSIPALPSFSSLDAAFSFIEQTGRKTIIVMDEYSDMKENARKGEVDSYMRGIIDRMPDRMNLIITGSLMNMMEELMETGNPLFARFTMVMKLGPMDYFDASQFFPAKSRFEQMELYCVYGGSPYVLSLLKPGKSLAENIKENIIPISGSIRSYIEAVINQEAGKVPHGITILSLIGNGRKKYKELEDVIGKDASGVLSKELMKLTEMDLISKAQPINKTGKSGCFYEITDPLIRFYFMYIYPKPDIMMINPAAFFEKFIQKSLKDFIARRFETACREYFVRLVRNGIRTDIENIGTYWYDDKVNKRNGEFDIAIKTDTGYGIYDAKFVSKPFEEKDAMEEYRQIRALQIPVEEWGIISASGFREKSNAYHQITLDDMHAF